MLKFNLMKAMRYVANVSDYLRIKGHCNGLIFGNKIDANSVAEHMTVAQLALQRLVRVDTAAEMSFVGASAATYVLNLLNGVPRPARCVV